MQALLGLSRKIDAFNTLIGRWLSWLIVVAVIISSANAIIRKLFDMSSNSFLELQWVLFSVVFLLCSPWTLLSNEHIRIDIINHSLPLKAARLDRHDRARVVPDAVRASSCCGGRSRSSSSRINQNEQSFSAGGLPQWPAKSLIMIACVLLIVQGISEIIKRAAMMRGVIPDSNALAGSQHAAELEAERLVMHIAGEKKP